MAEEGFSFLTEGQQEEWRKKLQFLQKQHRSENKVQQEYHLQQLRLLQEQLLAEISQSLSVSESYPTGGEQEYSHLSAQQRELRFHDKEKERLGAASPSYQLGREYLKSSTPQPNEPPPTGDNSTYSGRHDEDTKTPALQTITCDVIVAGDHVRGQTAWNNETVHTTSSFNCSPSRVRYSASPNRNISIEISSPRSPRHNTLGETPSRAIGVRPLPVKTVNLQPLSPPHSPSFHPDNVSGEKIASPSPALNVSTDLHHRSPIRANITLSSPANLGTNITLDAPANLGNVSMSSVKTPPHQDTAILPLFTTNTGGNVSMSSVKPPPRRDTAKRPLFTINTGGNVPMSSVETPPRQDTARLPLFTTNTGGNVSVSSVETPPRQDTARLPLFTTNTGNTDGSPVEEKKSPGLVEKATHVSPTHGTPTTKADVLSSSLQSINPPRPQSADTQEARTRPVSISPSKGISSPVESRQTWMPSAFQPPSPLSIRTQQCIPSHPRNVCVEPPQAPFGASDRLESSASVSKLRASLIEKHAKHIGDLKAFYEAELSVMSEKLKGVEQESMGNVALSARRSLNFDVSTDQFDEQLTEISQRDTRSPFDAGKERNIESEKGDLENQCNRLHRLLEEASRQHRMLLAQKELTSEHMVEWQRKCESIERTVTLLQERLDAGKKRVQEEQEMKEQLKADLQVMVEELQRCQYEREEDSAKRGKLVYELETLQLENEELHAVCSNYKVALRDKEVEVTSLKRSVVQHEAAAIHYKSVIQKLDSELRHMEHVRNRLHNMGTHYTNEGQQRQSYTMAEERKTASSQAYRSSSPVYSTRETSPLHTPQQSPSRNPGQKSLDHSPQIMPSGLTWTPPTTAPPTSSSPTPTKEEQQAQTDHLSGPQQIKRKWLEASDPGLFGVTPRALYSNLSLSGGGDGGGSVSRTSPYYERKEVNGPGGSVSRTSPYQRKEVDGPVSRTSPYQRKEMDKSRSSEDVPVRGDSYGMTMEQEREYLGLASSMLQAIKDGKVSVEVMKAASAHRGKGKGAKRKGKMEMSIQEIVKQQIEEVKKAEEKLVKLQSEKEKLEAALQRTPRPGSAVNRGSRISQWEKGRRLEEVTREIGSVRMTLRKYHALKK